MIKVMIGIQARSTSTRFPRKIYEQLGGKRVLDHVLDGAINAAEHVRQFTRFEKIDPQVVLLIPEGDLIGEDFKRLEIDVVEGPEDDVLTRFCLGALKHAADYIVRITADCAMLPPFVVSKHINLCVLNHMDYIGNCDEDMRTSWDGLDCEIMSRRALAWANKESISDYAREHVTVELRKTYPNFPTWLKRGVVIGYTDMSWMKLSLDTIKDLSNIQENYKGVQLALDRASAKYGPKNVFRL